MAGQGDFMVISWLALFSQELFPLA